MRRAGLKSALSDGSPSGTAHGSPRPRTGRVPSGCVAGGEGRYGRDKACGYTHESRELDHDVTTEEAVFVAGEECLTSLISRAVRLWIVVVDVARVAKVLDGEVHRLLDVVRFEQSAGV